MIDTNNYYPQRDGHIPELDNESTTTAELLQAHLPASKVVKAFNHIYAAELTTHGQPRGTPNRRALVIAGDDHEAKATVTHLLDQFGFDTVDAGPLKEGWRIQRDTPATVLAARPRNCGEISPPPSGTPTNASRSKTWCSAAGCRRQTAGRSGRQGHSAGDDLGPPHGSAFGV